MKKLGTILALVSMIGTAPLHAAHDTGLVLHDTGIGQRGTGVGIKAGVRITFGPKSVVEDSKRIKFGISAGPAFVLPDVSAPNGLRRGVSDFVGFEVSPGYSSQLNFAGTPLLVDYTELGAAEKDDDEDDGKQSTGDKVAWVAAVAGGVMVVLIAGATIALATCDDCSE